MNNAEESPLDNRLPQDLKRAAPIAGVVVSEENWSIIRGRFVIFAIVSLLLSLISTFAATRQSLGDLAPLAFVRESIAAGLFYFLIAILFGGLFKHGTARGIGAILILGFMLNQNLLRG